MNDRWECVTFLKTVTEAKELKKPVVTPEKVPTEEEK